jgi:hypothetical protein
VSVALAIDGPEGDGSLEVVGLAHGESPYWNYGGSSCVFSPIGLSKSLPHAQVVLARPFPFLRNLPWFAHQLASARKNSILAPPVGSY